MFLALKRTMKPDPLDDLLHDYARQQLLPSPPDLATTVFAEIAQRRGQSFWTRLAPMPDWRELTGEPRLAFAALTCALAIGILPALLLAESDAKKLLARQSIHFDVFSQSISVQLAGLGSGRPAPSSMPRP